jgi:DNA invertase Pin-like site-specific DNA recombinase
MSSTSERPPQTWGYGRASTRKQEISPEVQKDHIRAYVKTQQALGKMPPGDPVMFVDSAVSGGTIWDTRPAGRQLFGNLKSGDHVVISHLDRAFRRVRDCAEILDRFERMKIHLHIVDLMGGAIDLSSPMGRFFLHIIAAFAEMQRQYIRERTRQGLDKARKRKGFIKGGRASLGFRFEWHRVGGKKIRTTVPDHEERAIMKWIVQAKLSDPNMGWEAIAAYLGKQGHINKHGRPWSARTCRRAHKAELILQLREARQVNNRDDMTAILNASEGGAYRGSTATVPESGSPHVGDGQPT